MFQSLSLFLVKSLDLVSGLLIKNMELYQFVVKTTNAGSCKYSTDIVIGDNLFI